MSQVMELACRETIGSYLDGKLGSFLALEVSCEMMTMKEVDLLQPQMTGSFMGPTF